MVHLYNQWTVDFQIWHPVERGYCITICRPSIRPGRIWNPTTSMGSYEGSDELMRGSEQIVWALSNHSVIMCGSSSETSGVWERWSRWSKKNVCERSGDWSTSFSLLNNDGALRLVIHNQKVSYSATTGEWCSHISFSTQESSDRFASE